MMNYVFLANDKIKVFVNPLNGQLVGIIDSVSGTQFMHGAGKNKRDFIEGDLTGWNNSEITMFPIVGSAFENKVMLDSRELPMNQHGICRALKWHMEQVGNKKNLVRFAQRHSGIGTVINVKYNSESGDFSWRNNPYQVWPFNCEIYKDIKLCDDEVVVNHKIVNLSGKPMPYMIGFHPAFKMLGKPGDALFELSSGERFGFEDILEAKTLKRKNVSGVKYFNGRYGINIVNSSYNNMMFWTPGLDSGMFCMEPVSHLPADEGSRRYFIEGDFEVAEPGCSKSYEMRISPFVD